MKKPKDNGVTAAKIVAGIAATVTLGMNVTGCVYGPPIDPTRNEVPAVYGPPETFETQDIKVPEDTSMDPSDNQNADVYGPPEFFNTDPSDNLNPTVYGPPKSMETSEEDPE